MVERPSDIHAFRSIKMLEWALSEGWSTENAAPLAAATGNVEMLQRMIGCDILAWATGFHSGSEHVSIRARIRPTRTRLPMPRYRTISNGNGTCPSARSVAPGHVHIIPWLIQHGCRMVDGLCTITVENGDLPILTSCIWLQKAMRSNHLIRSPTMYLDR